jgi:photosystem II stability/assembly factor-like uncharacterized protein
LDTFTLFFKKSTMKKSILICSFLTLCFWINAQQGSQLLKAFESHQKLSKESPYKNINWRLTGPDNRSGRCTDVAGVKGNPSAHLEVGQVFYAGFATGGLWKTENGGDTWQPLFDNQATQSIGSIGIAPSNSDIVYVGTGEANILRASLPGTGMYKTTDGGKTFQHIGLENTGTIARIVVNSQNSDIVYVAASGNEWTYNADRGVYKTKNGGKTWEKIHYVDEKTGCIDLVIDPSDENTLYASFWNRIRKRWSDPVPENGDNIYKTTDAGKTWKIINKGLPNTQLTGRIGLSVSPSNPNVVYAFVDDHNKKRDPLPNETDSYERLVQKVVIGAAIYRSDDKGENWLKMGEIHDFFKPFSGTYGWVFSQIRVHPKNENQIYALGVEKGISMDAGKTWKKWEASDTTSDWTHGDNHALWFDPSNPDFIILGNDGGVCMTKNDGKKWKNFFDKIPTTQFYTVAYDMSKPFNIFGAVQDEGTMSGNETNTFGQPNKTSPRDWRMAPGGEGTQIQIDPSNPNIVFSSSYYGRLMKTDMSMKGNKRSTKIDNFLVGAIDSLRSDWLAATTLSKFNNNVIYHGLQHVYKSTDAGTTWQRISNDLSYNRADRKGVYPYLIYHQAITSITEGGTKSNILYAGTDDGRVWLTENDGKNWREITKGLPQNKHVIKITTSVFNDKKVYVVLNDRRADNPLPYIYESNDMGKTWKSIVANLPATPANVLIEDFDTGNLFCGTDMGVYMRKKNTQNWIAIGGNLPASVSINDMFIHPRDRKLVIGTYGRGVYILDDLKGLK